MRFSVHWRNDAGNFDVTKIEDCWNEYMWKYLIIVHYFILAYKCFLLVFFPLFSKDGKFFHTSWWRATLMEQIKFPFRFLTTFRALLREIPLNRRNKMWSNLDGGAFCCRSKTERSLAHFLVKMRGFFLLVTLSYFVLSDWRNKALSVRRKKFWWFSNF